MTTSLETIRTVTIRGQAEGIDPATQALERLTAAIRAANDNLSQTKAIANDNRESVRLTGEEFASAANHMREASVAAYTLSPAFRGMVNELSGPALKGTVTALEAVTAGIITATNVTGTGLIRLGAAVETTVPAFAALGASIKTAGTALEAFAPTVGTVASSILTRFLPALTLLSRALTIYQAIHLVTEAWRLGNEELEKYIELSQKAATAGVTTDFYQRIAKAAEAAKTPVDALTEAFKKLTEAAAPKLGGTAAQNRLTELLELGNFAGNSGIARLQGANSNEERLRAIADLYDQALRKGERLAGLDLARAFGGDALADNLAKSSDYLTKMVSAADNLKSDDLISAASISRAIELQERLDAAEKILSTRWHPVQQLLTALGIKMKEVWVDIVEAIAKAADAVFTLGARIASALAPVADFLKMSAQVGAKVAQGLPGAGPLGLAAGVAGRAAESALSVDQTAAERQQAALMADARRRLAEGLNRQFDTSVSKAPETVKQTREVATAYDRATESVLKYIKVTEAAAESVGKTAAEQEKAKVVAQLMAAAEKDGTQVTAALRAEMDKLAERAGAAAQALEKAKVAADIKFSRNTALLSQEDVQIATALKGLYPDVATALGSVEASAMRTNSAFREMSTAIESNLTSGLTDIVSGTKSVSDGFADMAKSIVRSIEQMVVKLMIVQPLMRALQGALGGGGLSLGSLFGGGDAGALAGGTAALHSGGIVGSEATFWHSAGAGAFNDNTPRFHSGGIAGDEVPIIARKGEGVFTDGQMKALGRGAAPVVNVTLIESATGQGSVKQSQNANGGVDIEVVIAQIAAKGAATPGNPLNRVLTDQLGGRQRLASR